MLVRRDYEERAELARGLAIRKEVDSGERERESRETLKKGLNFHMSWRCLTRVLILVHTNIILQSRTVLVKLDTPLSQ